MNKSLVPKIRFKEFINENNFQKIIFKKNDIIKIKTGKSDTKNALEIGKYTFFDRSEKIKRSNKYIFHGEYIIIPGEGSFLPTYFFNFVENSWWNKKNHQYDNLKTNFV